MTWRDLWARRMVILSALLTVLGMSEIALGLLWVEWQEFESTVSPLKELDDLAVRVNGAPAVKLGVPIYVHAGDELQVTRSVKSSERVRAELERVFNTANPHDEIDLPIINQVFPPGVTPMDPVIHVPAGAKPYMAYRYEVIAYDLRHAPKIFNDFTLCVLPPGTNPPAKIALCATLKPEKQE